MNKEHLFGHYIKPQGLWDHFISLIKLLDHPLIAFVSTLFIYLLFSLYNQNPFTASGLHYYNYLADAFLHGRLDLQVIPDATLDLSLFQGHYYLYWAPFPAILLMPLVSIFGINFSDVLFTIIIGAANIAVLSALLRAANFQGIIQLDDTLRGLLVLFFALGTPHLYLACMGRVWFTGMILGLFCILSGYLAAIRLTSWKAALLVGLSLAGALATRTNLIFNGIWLAWFLVRDLSWNNWRQRILRLLLAGLPILITAVMLGIYNILRFGSPLETGLSYHLMDPYFKGLAQQFGMFNIHYLYTNIYYQYLFYPFPWSSESFMGGSLFLLSPLYFLVFYGIWVQRRQFSCWLLVISIMIVNIPILLLFGTGFTQFGPRYTIDFAVPLLLLTAYGLSHCPPKRAILLVLISILQYITGTLLLSLSI